MIVHTRDARADTLAILREEKVTDCGGVLHCFTEDRETAGKLLDMGFYISFSGIVTFRNAEQLRDAARYVPLDRLLVETDSPYRRRSHTAAKRTSRRWSVTLPSIWRY